MRKLIQENDDWITAAIVGAVIITALIICSPSFAAGSDGLVIAQSGIFSGETTTYIKPLIGIKVVRPKSNLCFIATAPKWDVVLANTKSKTWCRLSTDTFKGPIDGSAMLILTGQNVEKLKWIKNEEKATTMFGIPVFQYQSALLDINTGKQSPKLKATLFAMKETGIPMNAASAVCTFLAFRSAIGTIPLKIIYPKNAENLVILQTNSVQRKTLAEAEFKVPNGFTKVANEQSVVRDKNAQEAIEEMVNSMGGK